MRTKSAWIRFVLALVATAAAFGCRAGNPQDVDSDLASTETRLWFAPDGSAATCEPPAAKCTGFNDDKAFVDLCVEKGFQARTCGCSLRCSGKLDYAGQGPTTVARATDAPEPTCSDANVEEATAILKSVRPETSLGRCVDAHLCHGMLGSCDGDDLAVSTRLRALSATGCEEQVAGPLCRDGFTDSLHCPETDVALLSKTWTAFRSKDVAAKRCIRKLVCSDDQSNCSADHLRQAQAVKAGVNRDGCEYWLRQFCSLGGNAW